MSPSSRLLRQDRHVDVSGSEPPFAEISTGRGLGGGDLDGAVCDLETLAADREAAGSMDVAAVAHASVAVAEARRGRREAADEAIGRAFALADASRHLGAKTMVALRYVTMLNVLDRPGDARKYAEQLMSGLRDDDPTVLRREAHQVSADIAAACGDWEAVRSHSLKVASLADGDPGARLQGLVGAANAAMRRGDTSGARHDAAAALGEATPGLFDSLRAAAIAVLISIDDVPPDIGVEFELEGIAERARVGGDTGGEAASRLTLGRWLARAGHNERALGQLDRAVAAAESAGHVFAWGKALITRGGLQPEHRDAVADIDTGWTALTQIVESFADPVGRQALLLDWRAMADLALAGLPSGPQPMHDRAARVALAIFNGMAVDVLREAIGIAVGSAEPSVKADEGSPDELVRLEIALDGRAALAFRVLRVGAELLAGWRLSVDEIGAVRLERFELSGAPAKEIKLLAERDAWAPTDEAGTWQRVADALLPATWSFDGPRLVVVPHGPLWLVPWAALRRHGQWLVEQASVSVAPSLSGLGGPAPARAVVTRAVAGTDLALAGSIVEVAHLRKRLGDDVVQARTPTELIRAMDVEPDLLLLSAHGSGVGAGWSLRLGDDRLSAAQLAAMSMPAIVVAASCLSGRQGFEPWPPTLVTGCLAAGVSSLIGGLWDLPDVATSRLVCLVVDELIDDVASVEEAMRSAQLVLARDGGEVRDWAGLAVFTS